ncbi:hypothetical protein J7T55_013282 [Diaporthe amygdali]|uniref:uncharacterized protein n=1 Tax=Phomopsis amygdali TaxID=1214568 RepID=UPI0022FEF170|nr:uncharacterized protein J7T55_013282 [Diaporthe amygdali]KAJ0119047.1 hypothetical protein J7T55_013282 [Diaporthe amygdali]
MHQKYGPVVRMAPNYLDLDYDTCASLIKTCFDTKGVWRKTEWHAVSGFKVGNETKYNIFSEVRPVEHSLMKKPVAKYWTTSAVARMEPHIDSVVAFFAKQLQDRYADGGEERMGKSFNFGEWAMFFAWDAVAKTTMSKRIGYLDHGSDFDGTLASAVKASKYLVTVGMYPVLDNFLDKNPVYRIGPPTYSNIASLAVNLLTDRLTGKDGHDATNNTDFMDHYIEAQKQYPDIVDNTMVISYVLVNLAAGADTSAAALRTIFYLTLKHPAVWKKLSEAVLAAPFAQPGNVQLPAPYTQTRAIPYLEVVIREALRLYPGNLFPQERIVPAGGLKLPDGRFVPEGTAVGFNAYAMHRNKAIWGPDAEEFRPERFLRSSGESEAAFNERMRLYNDSDLTFGAGSRRCIGMNLALMEVYKSTATLIAMFDFELATQDEWTVKAELFPRATGIICKIRQRPGMFLREDIDQSS